MIYLATTKCDESGKAGAISYDAVKHLLLYRVEQRPPRLDLENFPHLPLAEVQTTQPIDYMALLQEANR